jgi:CheY-like chemotaxis protein
LNSLNGLRLKTKLTSPGELQKKSVSSLRQKSDVGWLFFCFQCVIISPEELKRGMMMLSHPYPKDQIHPRVRVIVVDDSPQVRRDLHQLLELTGEIEVVAEAANGQDAVCLAAALSPNVIVMDLQMPGMDGFEATLRIKSEVPNVRVIILSIHAGSEEQSRAWAVGADHFVVKGESYEVLVNAIRGTGEASSGSNYRKGTQT